MDSAISARSLTRRFGNLVAVNQLNLEVPVASIYGFLSGAWPFGLVEAVWAVVAARRWQQLR